MVFFSSSSSSSSNAAVPPSEMSVSPVQKCILQRSFLGGSESKKNKKISCFKQISLNQENLKGYNINILDFYSFLTRIMRILISNKELFQGHVLFVETVNVNVIGEKCIS